MKKVIYFTGLIIFIALIFYFYSNYGTDDIEIILPFSQEYEAQSLIPMGETIDHPDSPLGHPGIDFKWNYSAPIIASASGKVTSIRNHEGEENWDVIVQTGRYKIEYQELSKYNISLEEGMFIERGSSIGYTANYPVGDNNDNYQIHWDIRPKTIWGEPYCPMFFFTEESKLRIEKIWKKTENQYKTDFPDICSGDFKNRY